MKIAIAADNVGRALVTGGVPTGSLDVLSLSNPGQWRLAAADLMLQTATNKTVHTSTPLLMPISPGVEVTFDKTKATGYGGNSNATRNVVSYTDMTVDIIVKGLPIIGLPF